MTIFGPLIVSIGLDGGSAGPSGGSGNSGNTGDKLLRVNQQLPIDYTISGDTEQPFLKYVDVKTQLPEWLVNSKSHIVDILQNYYNWLYDHNAGSGYYLDNIFGMIKDNETTPQKLVSLLGSNYIPDIDYLSNLYVTQNTINIKNISIPEGTVVQDMNTFGVYTDKLGLYLNASIDKTDDGGIYSTPSSSKQKTNLLIVESNPYVNSKTTELSINSSGDVVDIAGTPIFEEPIDSLDIISVEILPLVSLQGIRTFLLDIFNRFYNKKGTPEAIAYFFNTLLGTESTEVKYSGVCTYELTLNWKNYTIDKQYYEDYYLKYVHPIGTDYTINEQVSTDFPSRSALGGGDSGGNSGDVPQFTAWEELTYGDGAYDGTGTGQEISILGNYFPYTLGDTADIAVTSGCSGSTLHAGLSGGATGNTANKITYAFPDWSTAVTISGSSFGLINIYEFAYLDAASGSTSPNDGRVANYSCPVGGYT
tara:strand:- start:4839 stop:6272 length:1434 start_codon:yes stop_codon:yes gene_type:complete